MAEPKKSRWLVQRMVRFSIYSRRCQLVESPAVQIHPYRVEELKFAWCNRIYVRSRTHRRKPLESLGKLSKETLAELLASYAIHLLEFVSDETEYRILMSLLPTESVSVAVSKIKGRISKWLNGQQSTGDSGKPLARGYFAITTGGADTESVDAYLEAQAKHHGYDKRVRPPVFVRQFKRSEQEQQTLQTDHAVTVLRYHVVLATQWRQGVFASTAAESVCDRWLDLQESGRFLIDKVSFLPDHVHVAVSVHPVVKPGDVVVLLMNAAQESVWRSFDDVVLKAGVERLWQPGAYVGSFGDLNSNAISAWLKRWVESNE